MEKDLQSKKFKRKKENFVCGKCGATVVGSGYTDHCPKCLWSRHVDINPGDRKADCGGLMEPIGVEIKGGGCDIVYKCVKCHYRHKVKAAKNDDPEAILELGKCCG